MTKAATLYAFFSGFGLDAYEENSVYALEEPPKFPYLTYEVKTDSFGEFDTSITFSLWYRSTSWSAANAKVEEISSAIGRGGKIINTDGGYLLIMRGSPFAQSMGDMADDMVKRKVINITVRYYTSD
jgi:hypothetical protein